MENKTFKENQMTTDMYMLTMIYMYYKDDKHNNKAAFEWFYRKHPFEGQFTCFAGQNMTMDFIMNFQIDDEQANYFSKVINKEHDQGFKDWLKSLRPDMQKVWAVSDATIVRPRSPQITIEGPLGFVQLLETTIQNFINYPSLIATNAMLHKVAAGDKSIIEMGTRRAQGTNGALIGSLWCWIGGCDYSSNVRANYDYGVPISGTMGHSYVTCYVSLDELKEENYMLNGVNLKAVALEYREKLGFSNTNLSELAAFIGMATAFPEILTCLVDTYDTIESGVKNAIIVYLALKKAGSGEHFGIRLDSGDLVDLSNKARELFRKVDSELGSTCAAVIKIAASDGISESFMKKVGQIEHNIDVFGIGTNQITCQKTPALGMVCKLIEVDGNARLKFSANPEKSTQPYRKNLVRALIDGKRTDILSANDEFLKEGDEIDLVLSNDFKQENIKKYKLDTILLRNDLIWDPKNDISFKLKDWKDIKDTATSNRNLYKEVIKGDCEPVNLAFTTKYMHLFNKERQSILEKLGKA